MRATQTPTVAGLVVLKMQAHKVPGYAVHQAGAGGTAVQMEGIAELADRYGFGTS
jgi:hypothetical protein